jgi:hypothetical protein
MPKVTPDQMAEAIFRQQLLTTSEAFNARCKELAASQHVMFMELVGFARTGATVAQISELIAFLSVMQYLAESISKEAAEPVNMEEYRDAVERAICWFRTLDTDDPDDLKQMLENWLHGMERLSEPVIWAWVVDLLRKNNILTCSQTTAMVVIVYAVADVFSRRIANLE